MRYDILKDYEDKDFLVQNEDGEKEPLHLIVGEVFIPAQFNYPVNKRDGLVLNGTIRLTEPPPPAPKLPVERPPDAEKSGV